MHFKACFLFLCVTLSCFARPGYFEPWGKDADLLLPKPDIFAMPSPRADLLSHVAEALILFNQNVLSPAYGPRSHFRPTSSRYMLLCIRRYGFFKGAVMGFDRLLRENGESWIYRTVNIDGYTYKWDPTYGKP